MATAQDNSRIIVGLLMILQFLREHSKLINYYQKYHACHHLFNKAAESDVYFLMVDQFIFCPFIF